jgi:microcystin-dependent protein
MTAVNWNTPALTDLYQDFLSFLKNRDENIGKLDFTGDSNIPTNFKRYNTSTNKFENWNGAAWANLAFHTTIDNHIADTSIHNPIPAGSMWLYGAAAAPTGWLLCDGAAVSRATYAALFAVVGTTFGAGDGSTTFNLPDLRGRFPLGKAAAGTGSTLGGTGGSLDHTHTGPSHTHTVSSHTHDMGNHTHNTQDHSHTQPSHTHTVPAHYHDSQGAGADIAVNSSGSHAHGVPTRANITAFNGGSGNYAVAENNLAWAGAYNINSQTAGAHPHAHGDFTGKVGNVSSGNSGDGTLNTGSGGNDNTGSIVGSPPATLGPSTNTTSATALTTNAGGTGATGTNNPAFQVINYIIKT